VVDFLLVLIELLRQLSRLRRYERILVEIVVQILEGMGVAQVSKTRVPGLLRGVISVILRLAVLIQYRHVTNGQTDRQTMTASTALA